MNFALQVGSIAETVIITADDFHMNTTDGSFSTVVDQSIGGEFPPEAAWDRFGTKVVARA